MQSRITLDSSNKDGKILLIGHSEKAAIDTSDCASMQFHIRQNILDAIATASINYFDVIAVIPDNFDENFTSALSTLRKINPKSKILLLAQMWQEPKAAKLTSASNGTRLADDYYILPASFIAKKSNGQSAKDLPYAELLQQQRQHIETLEKLVMEDELTGVKNRRFVREFLRQITARASRESLQVTLLIFDIDNFKQYNDLYGHLVGDSILKQAAVLMQKCCRKQDVVARYGGDEFAVVFWNLPPGKSITFDTGSKAERRRLESEHPRQVINICERFRRELNKTDLPALGAEGKGILTISGGLATFPQDGSTVQELFTQADKALLEAKRSGKNRVYLIGRENNHPQQA
jgi:two-component system cell cycle response regulator